MTPGTNQRSICLAVPATACWRHGAGVGIALLALVLAPRAALAQYWLGGTTDWGTVGNWSANPDGSGAGSVPTNSTFAAFSATSIPDVPTIVTLGGSNRSANRLRFNGSGLGETLIRSSGTDRDLLLAGTGRVIEVFADAGPVTIGSTIVGENVRLRIRQGTEFSNESASPLTILGSVARESGQTGTLTLTITGSGDTRLLGSVFNNAGTLQLAKTGSGTLTLAGNNSMGSGTLTLGSGTANHGYIRLASNAALGNYSTVNLPGNNAGIGGLELDGGVTITGKSLTTAGRSNATTTGYVLRNISGDNTWGGTVSITATGGNYGFISDAGTLTLSSGLTTSLSSATAARSVTFTGDGDFSVAGITGGGGLTAINVTKDGTGTLTLTAATNSGGSTTIAAGTLAIGAGGESGSFVGGITNNATLAFNRSDSLTHEGAITGSGTVLKRAAGTLTLTAANTFAGGTTIEAGGVNFGNVAAFGSGTVSVTGNALIQAGVAGTVTNALSIASGISGSFDTQANDVTLSGPIGGAGGLVKQGSGTLALTALNTFTGGTTISAGTLAIGGGGETGSLVGDVVNDAWLEFNRSGRFGLAGDISGSGTVGVVGPGIVTLSGTNSYQGGTAVEAGVLVYTTPAARPLVGTTTVAAEAALGLGIGAGRFSVADFQALQADTLAGVVLNADALAGIDTSAGDVTVADALTGSRGLAKTGSGTLTLAGANTYAGLTSVLEGTLVLAAPEALSDSTMASAAAGTVVSLRLGSGLFSIANFQSLQGNSLAGISLDPAALAGIDTSAGDVTVTDALTGSRGLAKTGSGTLTLSATNTYSGGTLIESGTLALTGAGTLPSGSPLVFGGDPSARLDMSGLSRTVAGLSGAGEISVGSGTLTVNVPSGSDTFSGGISGGGGLTKTGAGTLVLDGTNSFTGSTTLSGGTLRVAGGSNRLAATSTLALAANSTFDVGDTSQTLAAITTPATGTTSYTLTGAGGTLVVNGTASMQLGPGGAGSLTAAASVVVDMSGLSTFAFTNTEAGSVFRVGVKPGSGNTVAMGELATVTLAPATTITTRTLAVADQPLNNDGGSATLRLGAATTLNVDQINSGASGRSNSVTEFAAGADSPAATIRATDGTGPVALWRVGNIAQFSTAAKRNFTDVVDFSAGSLDAKVTDLRIGNADIGTQVNRAGTQTSSFLMAAGTLEAGTITLARMSSSGAGSVASGNALIANGTLTLSDPGGLIVADTLNLTESDFIGTGGSRTANATLNLTAGTIQAATIRLGPAVIGSTATQNATFNWTDGTLANKPGGDLAITAVPITLLAGTHTFDAEQDRTITVAASAPIAGVGGFVKAGEGTLALLGANPFTGTAALAAGTVRVGNGRSLENATVELDGGSVLFDPGITAVTFGGLAGDGSLALADTAGTPAAVALTVGGNNASTSYSGILSFGGSLTKLGTGTLALAGASTFTGGTTIAAGTLVVDAAQDGTTAGPLGGTGTIAFGGGVLRYSAANQFDYSPRFSGSAGQAYRVDSGGQEVTWANPLQSSDGSLEKLGEGTLTLSAASTYGGGTTIGGGTLRLAGGDDRLPTATGLSFAGTARLALDGVDQTVASISTASQQSVAAVIVGGTLTVNGAANTTLGPTGSNQAASYTVGYDFSGLDRFVFAAPANRFRVGFEGTTVTGSTPIATAILAPDNTLTAAVLAIADVSGNQTGGSGTLQLGLANTVNAGTINVGFSGRSNARLEFAAGSSQATFRGVDGTSPVAQWLIGRVGSNSSQTWTSTSDFSAGSIDAAVTSLLIGVGDASVADRQGTADGSFVMGAGTLVAGTITIGEIAQSSPTGSVNAGSTLSGQGRFTLGNAAGLVEADAIALAANTITTETGAARTTNGTLEISAGTLRAGSIGLGPQAGSATSVSAAIDWTGGTIGNLATGDLSIANVPIGLAAGTGTFAASAGRTIEVAASAPISGAGSLAKTGPGTLRLLGEHGYTGATTVAAGRLAVDGTLTGTAGLTVAGGAELGGSGTILATIGGGGLVGPGNSPGITTAEAVDPTAGLSFAFEFTAPGDPLWSNAAASVNDVLRLTAGTPFTAPLTADNVVSVYFDMPSLSPATFRGGFFSDAGTDFLASIAAATVNAFVRGDGGGSFSYNGVNYYTLSQFDPALTLTLSTPSVPLADFAGGSVTGGTVTQFVVVPEPGSLLLAAAALAGCLACMGRRRG